MIDDEYTNHPSSSAAAAVPMDVDEESPATPMALADTLFPPTPPLRPSSASSSSSSSRPRVIIPTNVQMSNFQWLHRRIVGGALKKSPATHHNGANKEFYVVNEMEELRDRIIASFNAGTPLPLNERPDEFCRLFVDLDVNKKDGDPRYDDHAIMEFCEAMAQPLMRLLRRKLLLPAPLKRQMKLNHLKLYWPGGETDEAPKDKDGKPTEDEFRVWRWLKDTSIAASMDEDATFNDYMVKLSNEVDLATAVILHSPLKDSDYSTYHITWPFLCFHRMNAELRAEFYPNVEYYIHETSANGIQKFLDGQVWDSGALRGYLCDNFKEGQYQKRPFLFKDVYTTSKSVRDSFLDLPNQKKIVFAASSLLFPCETGPAPVPLRRSIANLRTSSTSISPDSEGSRSSSSSASKRSYNGSRMEDPEDEPAAAVWPPISGVESTQMTDPAPPPVIDLDGDSNAEPGVRRRKNLVGIPDVPPLDVEMGDADLEETRRVFPLIREEFDPQTLYKIIRKAYTELPAFAKTADNIKENVGDKIVRYLNRFFAVMTNQAKADILFKNWLEDSKYPFYSFMSDKSFELIVMAGGIHELFYEDIEGKQKIVKIDAPKIWREHRARLHFKRTVFKPLPATLQPGELNTYFPPAISAQEAEGWASHSIQYGDKRITLADFQNYIKDTICDGKDPLYNYIVYWLASTIQRSYVKLGTSLIILGPEGCGKDTLMNTVGCILGKQSYLTTANESDMTSQFNHIMTSKTLVVFNEANRMSLQTQSRLKSLITDTSIRVERKYHDADSLDNYINVVVISNLVNHPPFAIGYNARRWVLVHCGNKNVGKVDYWQGIYNWLGIVPGRSIYEPTPGIRAVADWLYKVKIPENWNPRDLPPSRALNDMKKHFFHPAHAWWYESLCQGEILGWKENRARAKNNDVLWEEHPTSWETLNINVNMNCLFQCFSTWCGFHHNRGFVDGAEGNSTSIGAFWEQLPRVVNLSQITVNRKPTDKVRIPQLEDCKKRFKELIPIDFELDLPTYELDPKEPKAPAPAPAAAADLPFINPHAVYPFGPQDPASYLPHDLPRVSEPSFGPRPAKPMKLTNWVPPPQKAQKPRAPASPPPPDQMDIVSALSRAADKAQVDLTTGDLQ